MRDAKNARSHGNGKILIGFIDEILRYQFEFESIICSKSKFKEYRMPLTIFELLVFARFVC